MSSIEGDSSLFEEFAVGYSFYKDGKTTNYSFDEKDLALKELKKDRLGFEESELNRIREELEELNPSNPEDKEEVEYLKDKISDFRRWEDTDAIHMRSNEVKFIIGNTNNPDYEFYFETANELYTELTEWVNNPDRPIADWDWKSI